MKLSKELIEVLIEEARKLLEELQLIPYLISFRVTFII